MYFPRLLRVGAVLCLVVAGGSTKGQTIIHVDDDAALVGDGTSCATALAGLRMHYREQRPRDEIRMAEGTP